MSLYFGLTKQELNTILELFHRFPEIDEAILFGSRAMGREKRGSDIDIALKGQSIDQIIPRVIQESGNDKEAAQIFCLEQATIAGGKARVKTENLAQSGRSQNRFLNHERYTSQVSFALNQETLLPYYFDILDYQTLDNAELKSHINRVGIVIYKKS